MAKFNDYNFAGKKAIVRVDFNVPLNEKGEITDDTRIRGAVPTLKKILADGGSLIIMSHMGKPKGKINHKLSLSQITSAVAAALGRPIQFAQDSAEAKNQADALKPGGTLVYGTCALSPMENDDVVKRILKKRPAMRVEPLESLPEGADRTECGVHILPDRCNGCGPIYCARLVKQPAAD